MAISSEISSMLTQIALQGLAYSPLNGMVDDVINESLDLPVGIKTSDALAVAVAEMGTGTTD